MAMRVYSFYISEKLMREIDRQVAVMDRWMSRNHFVREALIERVEKNLKKNKITIS